MNLKLTLDMIYNLPTTVINISEQNEEFEGLISDRICSEYDISDIKSKLARMFDKFNGVKFYYNIPISDNIKITGSYEVKEGSSQQTIISKQDQAVTKKLDSMIWASDFYDSIISLAKGLTKGEAVYLVYGLFAHKSTEYIAEIINVSERTVRTIKRSCLVKTWLALEALYEKDK